MSMLGVSERIIFCEVDRSRWEDMEKLFESRGGPKNCWCMVWRGSAGERADKISRKAAIRQLVQADVPVGILGYLEGSPIAWCSVAPRPTYRDLGGLKEGDSENVWSVVCFFVARPYRGQGVMRRLMDAAVRHAALRGATVVEAYPVDPDSPSYRFMGFVPDFEEYGFIKVGVAGSRRHVMRLTVNSVL